LEYRLGCVPLIQAAASMHANKAIRQCASVDIDLDAAIMLIFQQDTGVYALCIAALG